MSFARQRRKGEAPRTRVPFSPMSRPIVHLIPHTHWDREWYLPLGGFRARLVVALDDLLARLEAESRIRSFLLDGQTVLIEDYLSVRPERVEAVVRLVRDGRLQLGPWHVLADEQIPAGESLIRNLLLGGSVARRLGGSAPILYSPDAFGHPASLPAIGVEFGIRHAVVWRGLGTEETGGRDLFFWESPSGARVLTYHLPKGRIRNRGRPPRSRGGTRREMEAGRRRGAPARRHEARAGLRRGRPPWGWP